MLQGRHDTQHGGFQLQVGHLRYVPLNSKISAKCNSKRETVARRIGCDWPLVLVVWGLCGCDLYTTQTTRQSNYFLVTWIRGSIPRPDCSGRLLWRPSPRAA
jgi:hypothetical protein